MSKLQQIFANCPHGAVVMDKDMKQFTYAKGKTQIANFSSFGYKLTERPVGVPEEIENTVEADNAPLTSADFSATDAVALIEENNYAWGVGFVSEQEERKTVLKALENKKLEA